MRIKAVQIADGEWKYYEIDHTGLEICELKGVRGGTIGMGYREKSEIRLHVDLIIKEAFGEMVTMCESLDGQLRQVKKIEFMDGTVDNYFKEKTDDTRSLETA